MVAQVIINKYAEQGKNSPNGEIYLHLSIGAEFVAECSELEIAVVGVEFFHRKGEHVIPVIPIISIDCSSILDKYLEWKDVVNNCNKAVMVALDLEITRDNTQYFNPSLLEETEWK